MLQRLVYIVVASAAVLAGVTVILGYFSDILPLASTEPQTAWRFEAAFFLTATQWIALAVVAIGSIWLLLLLSARARSQRAKGREP